MAREIKFRALNDHGIWCYGYYEVTKLDQHVIHFADGFQSVVRPETVGQFTSIRDKNGKEIYEGDIGRINLPDIGYVNCVCDWNLAGFRWKKINEMQGIRANPSTSWSLCVDGFEVIGNTYANPELLD